MPNRIKPKKDFLEAVHNGLYHNYDFGKMKVGDQIRCYPREREVMRDVQERVMSATASWKKRCFPARWGFIFASQQRPDYVIIERQR